MKIALASIHPRALSGQIDCLVGLARELRRLGHAVRVVSAFPEDALLAGDRLALAGGDRGLLLPRLTRIRRIVARLVAEREADLVHFNLPTPAFTLLADLVEMRAHLPVVVGYEAHLISAGALLQRGRLLAAPSFYLPRLIVNNRLVARLALHRAARYIVSSRYQAAELAAVGVQPERVLVVPNLIDTAKFRPCAREAARRALGLPDRPLVVYAGHYNHVKGVDVLATAFARVVAAAPEARLVLAWSGLGAAGPVERALARAGLAGAGPEGRVIRLGKVDIATLLAAADVLVLPYRLTIGQAAFPGLVLEAMAVGVPLVTTDLPLLREAVEDGRTALLCPPEDPAALAACILRLLGDPALGRAMVAAQAAALRERFDPPALARRYVEIYGQVLDERRAAGARQAGLLQPAGDRRRLR